ncbi:hypothetical protein ACVWVY_000201 [Bradyrhizobium sp. URHC0002]
MSVLAVASPRNQNRPPISRNCRGSVPFEALADNKDVKEFYLGMSSEGRKSFRDMKSYRRRQRWV